MPAKETNYELVKPKLSKSNIYRMATCPCSKVSLQLVSYWVELERDYLHQVYLSKKFYAWMKPRYKEGIGQMLSWATTMSGDGTDNTLEWFSFYYST